MALKSMTGFARADGVQGEARWQWEARSVNGKGLELRLRLPAGFEALEAKMRGLAQEKLARGNCTLNLSIKRQTGQIELRLNEAALAQAAAAAARAHELVGRKPARLDTLLSLRGVVEAVETEEDEAAQVALAEALLAGLETVLDHLVEMRKAEGERLALVIGAQLSTIAALVEQAGAAPGRRPEIIVERLKSQVAKLAEPGAGLDPQRLAQEALLIAAKADIQEELDRLRAHIAAARELLQSEQPVGRKLDFLAQEFNREANTLCSKAGDVETSRIGIELKTVVDQLREQVQNIE